MQPSTPQPTGPVDGTILGMDERDDLAERVRRAVRALPPGTVATYGDVAELVGCGPRQVGRVMATDASDTPWWRVVNASGRLPAPLLPQARERWSEEGITVASPGDAVLLRRHRVDPHSWAARVEADDR